MNKRKNMITGFRAVSLIAVLAVLYRNDRMEVFLTAVAVAFVVFWVFPYLITSLIFTIFKLKENYGGTLKYDDSDPTNCKFRMIFEIDPEFLKAYDEFPVKVEKANLLTRDDNKD